MSLFFHADPWNKVLFIEVNLYVQELLLPKVLATLPQETFRHAALGDVVLFRSRALYHGVTMWIPKRCL